MSNIEEKFNTFLLLISLISWCLNIYKLCFINNEFGLAIARAAGIFLFPLGAVLGFF